MDFQQIIKERKETLKRLVNRRLHLFVSLIITM